jgi:hypothetical protein
MRAKNTATDPYFGSSAYPVAKEIIATVTSPVVAPFQAFGLPAGFVAFAEFQFYPCGLSLAQD